MPENKREKSTMDRQLKTWVLVSLLPSIWDGSEPVKTFERKKKNIFQGFFYKTSGLEQMILDNFFRIKTLDKFFYELQWSYKMDFIFLVMRAHKHM